MVCLTTWKTEPSKWRQFGHLKIGLAHGPDKEKILSDTSYDIVVMNYDGIPWAAPILTRGHKFNILLMDELPRLKNTRSVRFKAIKPLFPTFTFRWGLTGTPVANGYLDLFGQIYALDLGKRLGRFITHYRAKYFHQKPFDQFNYYITPEKAQIIAEKLKDLAMYIDPAEVLELPEFMVIETEVVLPPKAYDYYKSLEEYYFLKINETEVITAANAGVLTSKLRQATGGAVYTMVDGVRQTVQLHDAKMQSLESLVEEMGGEPLLVSYQFDHELARFMEKWPNALFLKGGMNKALVEQTVIRWNTGTVPLMFVQPSTAALGLNLQFGGSAICWYTLTYNLEELIQLNKRLHRQGQTANVVRCYVLAAQKTIDQRIAKVLALKDITQEDLLKTLKLQ